jgi:predicted porin
MKKTVIAMAVAAALPVTAQADITLSGSVSTEFTLGSDLVPKEPGPETSVLG